MDVGNNRELLVSLLQSKIVNINNPSFLDIPFGTIPLDFSFDERIEGMFLALCIGDALGNPTEALVGLLEKIFANLLIGSLGQIQ